MHTKFLIFSNFLIGEIYLVFLTSVLCQTVYEWELMKVQLGFMSAF